MVGSPHRLHHLLYKGPKRVMDPGNGGEIRASADLQICEMVVGAANETRTLVIPTKPGIRFILRLTTDGGGDLVVTTASGFNVAGATTATFSEVDDILSLVSVSVTATTYRWEILEGNVATGIISSTPTATSTASGTATSTSTTSSSKTASTTQTATVSSSTTASPSGSSTSTSTTSSTTTWSISGSDTASHTQSASSTASKTGTSTQSGSITNTGTSSPTSSSTSSGTTSGSKTSTRTSTLSSTSTATSTSTP